MNRNALIDAVANETELRKTEAGRAVEAVFLLIANALKNGQDVRLTGFGTFSIASRTVFEAKNPQTGEKVKIGASKQAVFKPGKRLRDSLD